MIFTARFGALAARPTFPDISESAREHEVAELHIRDLEDQFRSETSAV